MESFTYREQFELEDEHWWFRGRREVIWSLLRAADVRPPVRILDAGCGTGRNLAEFAPLGPVTGLEPSAEARAFCHARGFDDVHPGRLEALPFPAGAFDLVLATDVLEHVQDDVGALRELQRVSAPGGRLLATVPAYQWLWSRHDVDYHHFRRYTLGRLLARLRAGGWEPQRWSYFNSILLTPIALVRGLVKLRGDERGGAQDLRRTPRILNRLLELPLRGEARMIERGRRLPAGVSIGVVSVRR